MKKNLPVTQNEKQLRDDTLIVSHTDLKGKITYVNKDFLDISGFTEKELLGAAHNIVRHPDMPPGAFADMWETLKSGRPWVGYVKNRCKNGDFYWVEAHAAPIWQGEKITGYMSARRKAPRDKVQAAEGAYRRFRENKAGGLTIRDGWVASSGMFARLRAAFAHASVALKLGLGGALATVLVMAATALMLGKQMSAVLGEQSLADLQQNLKLIRGMVEVRANAMGKEAARLNDVFTAYFPEGFALDGPADAPQLRHGGTVLNQRYAEVDGFTKATGAVATLFARKGEDFVRVSTSVKKEDGSRAIGTLLDRAHPGYARLVAGERFVGKAQLFGKDYYTSYSPIKNRDGRVIGAGFVGLDISTEIGALRDKIKQVKVGATGYFFVLDARPGKDYGVALVHPAAEGKSLLAAKDAGGREFVREMLERKQGDIRYPWANPQLGDTAERMKVTVFDTFSEWQWLVGGGTYIDEFEAAQRSMQRYLWSAAAIVVAVLVGLVYWLVQVLVHNPLQNQVLPAFRRLSEGRYDNPLNIARDDEIGKVLQGLETMQNRLGFEVAESRRSADEMARVRDALSQVTVPVTVSDEQHQLIYMNRAAENLWTGMTAAVRLRNPEFAVEALRGARLSQCFGADAVDLLRGIEEVTETRVSDITLVNRELRVTASPVRNQRGQALGVVTQWLDRTAEIAVEREVSAIVQAAGAGDFTKRIGLAGKDGFFRQLAEGINMLTQTSEVGLNEIARLLEALARGDLTEKITSEYQGSFGRLKDNANTVVEKLTEIVGTIKDSTESVNVAAKEIAAGNTDLSSRTEQQASSLEETASSMEELTSTVKQNAENAKQANQLAESASDVAVKGGDVVGQVVTTMSSINESSKKIADIIGVIDGIAFQTNILALNAAVEAARAGEQGRGFAVVATEVRMLAQKSAAAAKEIKQLIGDSVDKVSAGTRLVDEAGQTMQEIVASVKRVTDIMVEITSASQEQSSGIEQVNQAINQMDEMTQQNAALVEEAAAAAESLEEQAGHLAAAVAMFKMNQQAQRATAARPAARPAPPAKAAAAPVQGKPAAARKLAAAPRPATAAAAEEWTEF